MIVDLFPLALFFFFQMSPLVTLAYFLIRNFFSIASRSNKLKMAATDKVQVLNRGALTEVAPIPAVELSRKLQKTLLK